MTTPAVPTFRPSRASALPANIPTSPASISLPGGVQAEIVALNGSMELAPGLGLSRLIVDLVQTGSTLRANGLVETDVIAEVSSRLIINRIALKNPSGRNFRLDREIPYRSCKPHRAGQSRVRRLSTADAGFEASFTALLSRAVTEPTVTETVREIIARVRRDGDAAVVDLTKQFDRVQLGLSGLRITPAEIAAATASVPTELYDALALAAARIEAFHRAQMPADLRLTDATGATMGLRWGPLDAVGIYVPGGKASYPSSVLMNAIPARVAGVSRIAMCVPAPDGALNPLVLAAASLAASPKSTASAAPRQWPPWPTALPSSSRWTASPALATPMSRRPSARFMARSASTPSPAPRKSSSWLMLPMTPAHIALDLLAQAEHDEDAQAICITTDTDFAAAVAEAAEAALTTLPRANIAGASWRNHGAVILVRDWDEAIGLANRIAPEHLQLMLPEPEKIFAKVRHAGAAFLGANLPGSIGGLCRRPQSRAAHVRQRPLRFRPFGLRLPEAHQLGRPHRRPRSVPLVPAAVALADAEGLSAHARSVASRLSKT